MTTSKYVDLSSFEPEVLLAELPGEHPKMTTALGAGRHFEQTGELDVYSLTQLANDLYAEGFPATAPLSAISFAEDILKHRNATVPETDSMSTKFDGLERANNLPKISQGSFASSYPDTALTSTNSLLGLSLDVPNQQELDHWLSAMVATASVPAETQPFYFIKTQDNEYSKDALESSAPAFDVNAIRRDFPILNEQINGRRLIWFDNAATTQKPQEVIDRVSYFYHHENSNIHRAAHALAARATDAYEDARETVRRFINASSANQIVFVRGTTEAINLVAKTWGKKHIKEGDEILISHLEHHANIVPWQQLCQETGSRLIVAPVDNDGQVILAEYQKLLSAKTKLVSFTQVSNALGTVTPAREMIDIAHRVGAKVLLDGAQSVSHMRTDVSMLNPDFFVFSGHKVFGPTGIGALYGSEEVLADMPAWQGGGNMIQDVTFEKTIYHQAPAKFEAGTGNIADAVGLGAALKYVERIGIDNIAHYEHALLVYATAQLSKIPGLRIIGTAKDKASVLSFSLQGYKSEEVGTALNEEGIAVRSGHHCAQPILRRFGVETTVRPSLAFYNTYVEIDRLYEVLRNLSSRG